MTTSHIIGAFYTWPFFVGAAVALTLQLLYQRAKAKREHCKPPALERVWIAGVITVMTLGYVLLTAQRAEDHTRAVGNTQIRCAEEFRSALKARSDITSQDTDLSNRISDIRSDIDETTATWIGRLLNPPPDIAALSNEDPRKISWKIDVTIVYSERTQKLRDQIGDLVEERKKLAKWRIDHPLPEIKC